MPVQDLDSCAVYWVPIGSGPLARFRAFPQLLKPYRAGSWDGGGEGWFVPFPVTYPHGLIRSLSNPQVWPTTYPFYDALPRAALQLVGERVLAGVFGSRPARPSNGRLGNAARGFC